MSRPPSFLRSQRDESALSSDSRALVRLGNTKLNATRNSQLCFNPLESNRSIRRRSAERGATRLDPSLLALPASTLAQLDFFPENASEFASPPAPTLLAASPPRRLLVGATGTRGASPRAPAVEESDKKGNQVTLGRGSSSDAGGSTRGTGGGRRNADNFIRPGSSTQSRLVQRNRIPLGRRGSGTRLLHRHVSPRRRQD